MNTWLESLFPGLRGTDWRVTSPSDGMYNCIAWAADDTGQWWWPIRAANQSNHYWPPGVAEEETLPAFLAAFATRGYVPCGDEALEPDFEKIAIFVNDVGVATHAARQTQSGNWTSKLGRSQDIEHPLRAIEGDIYGTVVQILKRPRTT